MALAPLAACTQADEPAVKPDPARYIIFAAPTLDIEATVGSFNTRALSRAEQNGIESFIIWGFCQAWNIDGNPNADSKRQFWNDKADDFTKGADVFNGDNVTVVEGGTTYHNGTLTPWDQDGDPQYSFIAVAGLDEKNSELEPSSIVTGANHGPRLRLTIPDKTGDVPAESQPDALVAYTFDKGPADNPIALKFMHIMTGIRFKFQNLTDNDIQITGVTYSGNFYKEAVFHFDSNKPVMTVNTDQTYTCTFNLFDGEQVISGNSADYMRPAGDPAAEPVTLRLLPNPEGTTNDDNNYTLGTDKVITINYQQKDANGDWSAVKSFSLSSFVLSYKPKPNTLHTATFNFVGDGFIVIFRANNNEHWENGSDSNITIH